MSIFFAAAIGTIGFGIATGLGLYLDLILKHYPKLEVHFTFAYKYELIKFWVEGYTKKKKKGGGLGLPPGS